MNGLWDQWPLAGRVCEAIVRAAARQNLTAPSADPVWPGPKGVIVKRIVVGVDGSEAAHAALRWAVEEARIHAAALDVVHAWLPHPSGDPYGLALIDPAPFEAAARVLLDAAVDDVDPSELAQPVTRTLRCGGASSVILDAADGADLIVVGSRGLGGFRGLLLGSVGQQVVPHAPCPVVVVPAEADQDAR
jgi:nucleotide-binding universal stress UspA family protein